MSADNSKRHPWFVRGDLDGFFGLFIDNLLGLMLVGVLCRTACGFPTDVIVGRILPGAAFSILAGNIFYAWQARRLARTTGRRSVTALPFGLNSVSLLAFVFLVMAPVYNETGDADLAWRVGLAACFLSGVIETIGAFFAEWLKRNTPRPALLSGLAGVALSFMTLGFTFQIFASPAIAVVPLFLILTVYGAKLRLPLRLPGGLLAVVIGTAVAWALRSFGGFSFSVPEEPVSLALNLPRPSISELISVLFNSSGWTYLAVIAPMGIFNIVSSIENLESAEAAGDRYEVKSSLLANGITTLVASVLGSPFPTTIYLGHPGWKAMGARSGYSVLNGVVVMVLCLIGGVTMILNVVPLEATLGLLIWVGLVIVAQAFQEVERRHAVAVVIGLLPSLAVWALSLIETSLRAAGTNLYDTFDRFGSELYIQGVVGFYQGFLLIAVILSAIMTFIIDRKFLKAAAWSVMAAVLSLVGLIHAYEVTPSGIHNALGWMAAPEYAMVYGAVAVVFLILHVLNLPTQDVDRA